MRVTGTRVGVPNFTSRSGREERRKKDSRKKTILIHERGCCKLIFHLKQATMEQKKNQAGQQGNRNDQKNQDSKTGTTKSNHNKGLTPQNEDSELQTTTTAANTTGKGQQKGRKDMDHENDVASTGRKGSKTTQEDSTGSRAGKSGADSSRNR